MAGTVVYNHSYRSDRREEHEKCVFYVKGTRPLPREVLQCGRSSARAQAALPRVALPPLAATRRGFPISDLNKRPDNTNTPQ